VPGGQLAGPGGPGAAVLTTWSDRIGIAPLGRRPARVPAPDPRPGQDRDHQQRVATPPGSRPHQALFITRAAIDAFLMPGGAR